LSDADSKSLLVTDYFRHESAMAVLRSRLRTRTNENAMRGAAWIINHGISKRSYAKQRIDLIEHDGRKRHEYMSAVSRALPEVPDAAQRVAAELPVRPSWPEFDAALSRAQSLLSPIYPLPTSSTTMVDDTSYTTTFFDLPTLVRAEVERPLPANTFRIPQRSVGPQRGAVNLCESPFVHFHYHRAVDAFNAPSNEPMRKALQATAVARGCSRFQYVPLFHRIDEDGTKGRQRQTIDAVNVVNMLLSPLANHTPELVSPIAIFEKPKLVGLPRIEAARHHAHYQKQLAGLFKMYADCPLIISTSFPGGPVSHEPILWVFHVILAVFSEDNQSLNTCSGCSSSTCPYCHEVSRNLHLYPFTASSRVLFGDDYRAVIKESHRIYLEEQRLAAGPQPAPVLDTTNLFRARKRNKRQKEKYGLSYKAAPAWGLTDESLSLLFSRAQRSIFEYMPCDAFHTFDQGLFDLIPLLILTRIKNARGLRRFDRLFRSFAAAVGYFSDGPRVVPSFANGIRASIASLTGNDRIYLFKGVVVALVASQGAHTGLTVALERRMVHLSELFLLCHSRFCKERTPEGHLIFMENFVLPAISALAPQVFPEQPSNFDFRKFHALFHMPEQTRVFGSMDNVSTFTFENANRPITSAAQSVSSKFGTARASAQLGRRIWFKLYVKRGLSVLEGVPLAFPSCLVASPPFSATAGVPRSPPPQPGTSLHGRVVAALRCDGSSAATASARVATLLAVPYVTFVRTYHERRVFDGTLRVGNFVRVRLPCPGPPPVASSLVTLCKIDGFYVAPAAPLPDNIFIHATVWECADSAPLCVSGTNVETPRTVLLPSARSSLLHQFVKPAPSPNSKFLPVECILGRALVYCTGASAIYAPELEPQLF